MVDNTLDVNNMTDDELATMVAGTGEDVIGNQEEVIAELTQEQAIVDKELVAVSEKRTPDEVQQLQQQKEVIEVDADGKPVHTLDSKYSPLYNIEEQALLDVISPDYVAPDYVQEYQGDPYAKEWLLPHVMRSYNSVHSGTTAFYNEIASQNWDKDPEFNVFDTIKKQEEQRKTSYDVDETVYLAKSRNYENFLLRQTQIGQLRKSQEVMNQRGTAANLIAGAVGTIVDVDMLLPAAKAVKIANTSKRAAKLINTLEGAKSGAITGVSANLAAGAVLAQTNPYYNEDDIMADVAMGALLGGTLGAVAGGLHGPDTADTVRYNDKGELEFTTDVDTIVDNVKKEYTKFEGQVDHSNMKEMPTTGADRLARSRAAQKQLEADLEPTSRVTTDGTTKVSDEARTTLADDVAARKAEERTPIEKNLENYSPAYKANKLATDDFKAFINVKGLAKKAEAEALPKKKDVLDTVVTGKVEEAKAPSIPTIKASNELITSINTRLAELYDTPKLSTPKVVSMNFKGDRATSVTTINKFGTETTLKGDEATNMVAAIRDMSYLDTSSALAKTPLDKRLVFKEDVDNINKYVIDLGTDATRLLKNEHSIMARSIVNKLVDTVTGDNSLQGQSAAMLKLGYETEYSVGLTFYKDNIHTRATQLESEDTFAKIFSKGGVYFADTSAHAKAQKEVSELLSDLDLGKGATMQSLREDLDSILNTHSKKLGSLSSDETFKASMRDLAKKYNIPEETLNATVGITMMTRSVLDSWKNPVKDSPDVLPVLGTDKLDEGYYQPQAANPEVINELLRNGATVDSIEGALAEAYYEGMRYRNKGMDDAQMRSEANIVAAAVTGRALAAPSLTAVEFAAKDTTAYLSNYIKLNPNMSQTAKDLVDDVLGTLKNEKTTPSVLKDRVPFDRTLEVTIKNKDGSTQVMKAGNMLKTPGLNQWIMYANRASGIAAMASKGINSEAQLNSIRKAMKQELDKSGIIASDAQKTELLVESLIAEIKSEPSPLSARHSSEMVKLVNSAKSAFSSSTLNMLGFAQIGEYGLIANGVNLRANMKNLGIESLFSKQSNEATSRTISYLNEMGTNSEMITLMRSPLMSNIEETGIGSFSKYWDKFSEVTHGVQRKFFGHQLVLNHQRNYSWLNSMTNIVDTLQKNDWQLTKKLKNKGWTEDVTAIIKREYDAGRMYMDDGALRLNYKGQDISDFLSTHDRIRLTSMLRSIEESTQILRPLPGQSFMATKDPMVGLLAHLQSYTLASLNNVLIRNTKYADASTIALVMSTAFASTMAAYAKAFVEGKTENVDVKNAIFKYNSLMAVPGMGMDFLADTVGKESWRVSPDYDSSGSYNVPLLSYLGKVMNLPASVFNILTLNGVSSQDARTLKATLPLFNNPFFARTINNYIDGQKEQERLARNEQKRIDKLQTKVDVLEQTEQRTRAEESERQDALETLTSLR